MPVPELPPNGSIPDEHLINVVPGFCGDLPSGTLLTTTIIALANSWAGLLVGPLLGRGSGRRGIVVASLTGTLVPALALFLQVLIMLLAFVGSVMLGIGVVWRFLEGDLADPRLTLEPMREVMGASWALLMVAAIVGSCIHRFSRGGAP